MDGMAGMEDVGEVCRTKSSDSRGRAVLSRVLDLEASWLSGRPSLHSSGLLGVAATWECLPCVFCWGTCSSSCLLPFVLSEAEPRFSGEAHRPVESAAL